MMKKVWLMLVLCSLMVAVGCSNRAVREDMAVLWIWQSVWM